MEPIDVVLLVSMAIDFCLLLIIIYLLRRGDKQEERIEELEDRNKIYDSFKDYKPKAHQSPFGEIKEQNAQVDKGNQTIYTCGKKWMPKYRQGHFICAG